MPWAAPGSSLSIARSPNPLVFRYGSSQKVCTSWPSVGHPPSGGPGALGSCFGRVGSRHRA
eukprot:6988990-Alexandrium_andersonii.AAC.1